MLWSPANLLTMGRIVVIPPIILFMALGGELWLWAAFGLYAAACVTDFFDGYLARTMNQVSALGRFLDPIADKLLVAAILLMLTATDRVTGWDVVAGLVILLREITVSGLREFLAEVRVGVPVSRLAKWKTTIQMLALGFLIVGDVGPAFLPTAMIGTVLLWAAAALTVVTAIDYLRAGLRHMVREG